MSHVQGIENGNNERENEKGFEMEVLASDLESLLHSF